LSGTTQVSRYQKGKTNLDFTEARDSEWQWHQLGHMQVYTSLKTDNHASSSPLSCLQAGCPSCRPTNSVKALKATIYRQTNINNSGLTVTTKTFQGIYLNQVCVREQTQLSKVHENIGHNARWSTRPTA